MFSPESFVRRVIEEIRKLSIDCIVSAVSGGVDSTTAAVITYRAVGDRLRPFFIDTGFMRMNEPESVVNTLRKFLPNIELIDVKEEFYKKLTGHNDAEIKRKIFRETFYNVFSRLVKECGCSWILQGTIAPDWIETRGGIKTQHNVLEQIGIDTEKIFGFKLLEPLKYLYKDQVRQVAKYLGLPESITNRQPFPGPGLLVRCVGEFYLEKLEVVRKATYIVEKELEDLGLSQWFAAVWEVDKCIDEDLTCKLREKYGKDVKVEIFTKIKATGVKGDSRVYGPVAIIEGEFSENELYSTYLDITTHRRDIARVVYKVSTERNGKYFVSIRAVLTADFMTADVARINIERLRRISEEILNNIPEVACVGYDITPKPPATIEYE